MADPVPFAHKLAAALADAVSAALFLFCWIAPTAWRPDLAADLVLVMVVEFILFLGWPIIADAAYGRSTGLGGRVAVVLALGSIPALIVAGFALLFGSFWVIAGILWLLGSKVVALLTARGDRDTESRRQKLFLGISGISFVLAWSVVAVLPVPELGLSGHGAAYGIPGSGAWVERPHLPVAAGSIYFALLSFAKLMEKPHWADAVPW